MTKPKLNVIEGNFGKEKQDIELTAFETMLQQIQGSLPIEVLDSEKLNFSLLISDGNQQYVVSNESSASINLSLDVAKITLLSQGMSQAQDNEGE